MRKITDLSLEKYKEYLYEEEKSTATVNKYINDLKKLKGFAGGKELTKSLVISYKEYLQEDGCYKTSSINSFLAAANCFFGFMEWFDMCRKFTMPEKLTDLLKTVAYAKKPEPGNYVAKLYKKAGRKRNAAMPEDTPDGRTLQYRLKATGDKTGIKGLTFKVLRDTFAVMCLQAGGDVYSLAYVMGTGIPAICERYGQWMVRNDRFLKILDK